MVSSERLEISTGRALSSSDGGRRFVFAGLRFDVVSDKPEILKELDGYVRPDDSVTDKTVAAKVAFEMDQELHGALARRCDADVRSGAGEKVHAKSDHSYNRTSIGRFSVFSSDSSFHSNDQHIVIADGSSYVVVASGLSENVSRTPLRVIREIVLRSLENRGGCFTHAAVVQTHARGKGILIVGDAGAGKSTTMWHLTRGGSAAYVSNDRCILQRHNGGLSAFGWPIAIRLGVGTLQTYEAYEAVDFSRLRRGQVAGLKDQRIVNEADARRFWGNVDKVELTPHEFTALAGCAYLTETVLDSTLIPRLAIGQGAPRLEPAKASDLDEALASNLREPTDDDYLKGWLGIRSVSDDELNRSAAAVRAALHARPAWVLRGDPRALPDTVRAIVEVIDGV